MTVGVGGAGNVDTDELRRLVDEAAAVPMGSLPAVAADKILRALGEALLTASALDAAREHLAYTAKSLREVNEGAGGLFVWADELADGCDRALDGGL